MAYKSVNMSLGGYGA